MDKKILSLLFLSFILLPSLAFAQLKVYGSAASIRDLVHGIERAVGLIFSCIAVVCFVLAGVLFLTAQGDAAKIQTAKGAFMWGIVGVVVGIVAYSIIALVGSIIR